MAQAQARHILVEDEALSNELKTKIDAAKMGKVAFLDPEIFISPDKTFLPFMINFCIKANTSFNSLFNTKFIDYR